MCAHFIQHPLGLQSAFGRSILEGMSTFSIVILSVGAIFIASRLVRLLYLAGTLRSVTPGEQAADAEQRARDLVTGESEDDDAQAVGVALALALREAESEARGREVDSPL